MKKIAQIGVVKVYWDSDYREYQCRIPNMPDVTYFTSDKTDALATAELMSADYAKAGWGPMPAPSADDQLPNWSAV